LATIILSLADLGAAMSLQDVLEASGHTVRWDAASASGPVDTNIAADLVMLDGEQEECVQAAEAWRDHDPPPALLIVGRSDISKQRSVKARCNFVASNSTQSELEEEIQSVLRLRFAGRMSGPYARALLGLGKAVGPAKDAAKIIAGARQLDLALVRECLRWRAYEYVCATELIATLRENRALTIPEVDVVRKLDGTRTVQSLVSSQAGDGVMAGRLLWGLLSSGAALCTPEPPDERSHDRKAIASARRHLVARRLRLSTATHYDVLEVTRDANAQHVDYAARTLAIRYAPERLQRYDLGDAAGLVGPNWQQILVARKVLMDLVDRANYDDSIDSRRAQLKSPWAFEVSDPSVAEEFFRRGQAALIAGEAFKAVSGIAGACRNHPDHPNYEAYLCWVRFRAEVDRGGNREELIGKERQIAEHALLGRRPWPPALVALALLCAADNDAYSARYHLHEALSVDPNLPAAKQLLGRLSGT
jgi:hypothetical protein